MAEKDASAAAQIRAGRLRRSLLTVVLVLFVLLVGAGISVWKLWHQAQPLLRARVVDSLAARFRANVQLDDFSANAADDFAVTGRGLRITPIGLEAYPPVISVDSFAFHMRLNEVFNPQRHVRLVTVTGLRITLPPKAERKGLSLSGYKNALAATAGEGEANSSSTNPDKHITAPKFYVDAIVARDAELTLLTDNPGKVPLHFAIHKLHLTTQWATGAMLYKADLTNAKPVGEIHSEGTFGPWDATNPRATPISGDFTFNHADLATTKGIAGILDSRGHFGGPLDDLTVDGHADVPDFRIDEAEHAVKLHVDYHARVDGSSGDTYLQPADAHFRNTFLHCTGSIVRVREGDQSLGHHISLQVAITKGRIEDLLWLAVRTAPPVITGNLQLHNSLDIPPDPTHNVTIARRMNLQGAATVTQLHFADPAMDKKVDEMSLRTQGKPQQANDVKHQQGPDNVTLDGTLRANFTLRQDVLALDRTTFNLPGLDATLSGTYALASQQYNFQGEAKSQARVSQMVTGWRSALLKPFDKVLAKHGAGTFVPFHIQGTKDSPKFGIDIGKL